MKEKISKIGMWIFTAIIFVATIGVFKEKDYITAIIVFIIAAVCSPLVQDKIFKVREGYFREMKMILTFLGVIFCLMVMQIYVKQMSAQGIGEADIFDKMKGYLKILVYLLYLCVIFMYKDESQLRNYIIFGIIYMVCVIFSYIPSCDKSIIVSILNKLAGSQDLNEVSYNVLINDILMPIKESFLTYIIFDTVMHKDNKEIANKECEIEDKSLLENEMNNYENKNQKESKFAALVMDKENGNTYNYTIKIKNKK